jgi:hypothetical protein
VINCLQSSAFKCNSCRYGAADWLFSHADDLDAAVAEVHAAAAAGAGSAAAGAGSAGEACVDGRGLHASTL